MKTSEILVGLGIAYAAYKLWGSQKQEAPVLTSVGPSGDLTATTLKSNADAVEQINKTAAAGRQIIPATLPPSSSPSIKTTDLRPASSGGGSRYTYDPIVKALTETKTGNTYQTTGKVTTLATGQKVVLGVRTVA